MDIHWLFRDDFQISGAEIITLVKRIENMQFALTWVLIPGAVTGGG